MKKILLISLFIFLATSLLYAFYLLFNKSTIEMRKNERYYQTKMCDKLAGNIEVILSDKTRVDCLTDVYAIEVDWAKKWAEGIGQSLYYAHMTNKKPAIGLIVGKKDSRYLKRLNSISEQYGIHVILINKEE